MLLMLSLGFAAIIESGDNGEQFAKDTIQEQCQAENIRAVYHCNGNIVKAVSSVPGAGSTFYKPDGAVVVCPVAAPTDMGAVCIQMLHPNFCPSEAECGSSPEEVFPGLNETSEEPVIVVPPEEPEAVEEPVVEEPQPVVTPPVVVTQPEPEPAEHIPTATQNEFDTAFADLTLIIIVLGVPQERL